MSRQLILSAALMAVTLTAAYFGLIGIAHLVYVMGWHA